MKQPPKATKLFWQQVNLGKSRFHFEVSSKTEWMWYFVHTDRFVFRKALSHSAGNPRWCWLLQNPCLFQAQQTNMPGGMFQDMDSKKHIMYIWTHQEDHVLHRMPLELIRMITDLI